MADDRQQVLARAAELAIEYLESLPEREVRVDHDVAALRERLIVPLPEDGELPLQVIEALARDADPGIVAMAGPRYFGFVIGGSLPAALAADWLTSTWDQNAGLYVAGPAAAVVEEAVGEWLIDLFGLPAATSFGLTTGCQMAHVTCLAAARHAVLERRGWDVESRGLFGAPEIQVVIGAEAHSTLLAALQYLGLGRDRVRIVPTDDQGRVQLEDLARELRSVDPSQPLIVCLQAGNVNTGSFDPIREAVGLARGHEGAWVHVDGAFGMWARVSPRLEHLLDGVELADSWATDAHKWLNVPYDSGIALVAHPKAHAAAMSPPHATYLQYGGQERDEMNWVPEFSRRARGFAAYAALRSLGRSGIRALVEGCCDHARAIADRLSAEDGIRVLNDVVLNQVLVRFDAEDGDATASDALTRQVIVQVQEDARIWLSGTTWHGMAAMRISVSNWSTTAEDAQVAADAIIDAARRVAPSPQAA
ncbi:MAG: aspartate aminotransferase family protein [Chloroflexi bacterium]|nr:aspartate aminotransferase family protein [Chloroflexota bacterium]